MLRYNEPMEQLPSKPGKFVALMIRPYKKRIILFAVLSLLGMLSWTAAPYIIRLFINELSQNGHPTTKARWLVVAFFVAKMSDEVFWRIAENGMRKFKPAMIERMRSYLFTYVLQKPYGFFVNSSSGQLGHWINQSTSTFNEIVDTTIWGVWPRTVTILLSAIFLLTSHWLLALIFTVWVGGLTIFNIKRGRRFGELVEHESDARSVASGMVVDALGNHLSVRVFNARQREVNKLHKQQSIILRRWDTSWFYHIKSNIVKGSSAALAAGVAMVAILHLYGNGQISIGDVALFIAYFSDASSSIWELTWQLDTYYRNFGTIKNALDGLGDGPQERTVALLDAKYDIPKTKDGTIRLNGVSFSYPDQPDRHVLKDVTLTIKDGERIGLVGHSGAGKTTLVAMLLGFYEPTAGEILIGGHNTKELDPSEQRAHIAYVPQDTSLFNRTLADNIAYAQPGASLEKIALAAQAAQAADFIEKLPDGYKTMIGERGVKLSGGQRQRVAIARALLKDAPILVLDEATSALDSVSEQAIQKAFATAMKGRTAVVVAHRLSTLRHLDKIVVFEAGTIAEAGTHDELVVKNGIYADLWRRQKDGFIAE